jgi:hypothetical protein
MKNYILLLFLALSSCVLAQKPTRNIGREQTVPLSTATGVPVIVDSSGKKVGRLVNPAEIATSAQMSLKASQTDLSNLELQLRSDLATKSALIDSIKSFVVAFHYSGFTPNTPISVDYSGMKNGWHAIHFSNTAYGVTYDANSQATVPVVSSYYDATTNTYTNAGFSTTSIRDNNILMAKVENGAMVAWYTISPNSRLAVEVAALKTLMGSKASASDLSAEAAARVAGDAVRPTFGNLSDSLSGVWRDKDKTISLVNDYANADYYTTFPTITTPTGDFGSASNIYPKYLNFGMRSSKVSGFDETKIMIGNTHLLFGFNSQRANIGVNRFFTKGNMFGGIYQNGVFAMSGVNLVSFGRVDSVQNYQGQLLTQFADNKALLFGNGVGLYLSYRKFNVYYATGLQFYNQLNQDTIDFSRNPQKGHLISIRDEGKLAIKRRDGNTITAYDRALTDYEVKSKPLTLTTATTPTLDFENGIQVTYVLTTVQNGDFFSSSTISNLRDGGIYRIRFKANNTGNVFTFPSNVFKKDGTAMGAYAVTSETLVFHAEGTDLICDNK